MKNIYCVIALLACGAPLPTAADSRPNIVLIISDDQAWTDYGFMGHSAIETPRLDELARRSLLFPRGYVAAPLCRPSLASMVTGLYPSQHGTTGNDVDAQNNRATLDEPLRRNFHQKASLIRRLTESGYLTHQSGKWWEGSYADGGFTHGMTHGDPDRRGRHGDAGLTIGRQGLEPIAHFIDLALGEQKPFFLWYAPFLPHTPHNPPERFLEKYQRPDRADDVAKYYAMCEWFDETCGKLLDLLDRRGIADNTLVFYICDNGWAAPSTNADDPNQALWDRYAQRSKSSPYENGVRTPIMISWPGRVPPGRTAAPAHAVDIFPTLAAAAGVEAPAGLPGVNLMDDDARESRRRVFGVCHSTHNMTIGNPDDTLQYLWCVDNEWKLLVRYHGNDTTHYRNLHTWDTAPERLYRIKDDPHEQRDLAEQHPEVVARLKKEIDQWRQRAPPTSPPEAPLQPDDRIVYKTTPQADLHLHVFRPRESRTLELRPAIVFFFGGGWVRGEPSQFYPHCRHLASQGMVAMAAEYRVESRHGTSPRECVQDGKSAVRWIRRHAADLGVDPEKVVAGGGSAGGHVAAACGSVRGFNEAGEAADVSARPAALVLFNPVFDNSEDGYGHERVKDYWREFSPLHNIDEATPPTVVFLGEKDKLIPVETAQRYQRTMAEAGRRCDLHLFQQQEHGFFNFKNPNYYAATVAKMDKFLASLGYVEANP